MIKKIMILLFIYTGLVIAGENWFTNFDEAKQEAAKSDKKIMLYFSGSDWCRPCILLKKKVFETEEFKKFANENLTIAMFDFPARDKNKLAQAQTEHNEKMAELYNPEGNFPQIVLLSNKGEKIIEFAGYGNESAEDYISKLEKAISASE